MLLGLTILMELLFRIFGVNSQTILIVFALLQDGLKMIYCTEVHRNILYAVKEETEIGNFVGNLNIDTNIAKAQPKSIFKLYDDGKLVKYFSLEASTGKLYIAQRIDRETICPTSFSAQDRCQVELTVFVHTEYWINVIITIQDVNDHQPKFAETHYQVQISEAVQTGYRISLRTASDPDVEPNNVCTYSMHGFNDTFNIIFSNLLYLIVTNPLDYETQINYKTTLIACDCGAPSLCGNQTLAISVLDINDNQPTFIKKEYKVTIMENTMVGEVVANVTAVDTDSGLFGQVRYRFGQVQDPSVLSYFYISSHSGEIKLQRILNSKNIAQDFSLNVEASDGGSVPKVGYATVFVHLMDMNNQRPIININSLGPNKKEFNVKENQTSMSHFAIIWVSDGDIGVNAEVDCKLNVGGDSFKLSNSQTVKGRDIYTLQPRRIFDREIESHFLVRMFCADRGSPQLTTEEEITVKIQDVNEFSPRFKKSSYSVKIPENSTNGLLLIQLQASDDDATAQLIYEVAPGTEALFTIDPVLGYLRTAKSLDREKKDKIQIIILAIDPGEPIVKTASTTVIVTVTDVNDNPPGIINPPRIEMKENERSLPIFLTQLQYEDADLGENGTVMFYIQNVLGKPASLVPAGEPNGNLTEIFTIDELSGNITLHKPLDREYIEMYTIYIMICDQGQPKLSSIEAITVRVLDTNDNSPKWVHPTSDSSNINTSTVLAPDQRIIIAQAIDPDSPSNANITYHVTEGNEFIYIDSQSGEIRTRHSIGEGNYVIKLLANDNGDPNLSTEIKIKLYVSSISAFSTVINFSDDQFRIVIVIAMVTMGGIVLLGLFIFLMFMKRRSVKLQCERGKYKSPDIGTGQNLDGFCGNDNRWADVMYSPVNNLWYGTANMHYNPASYNLQELKSETSKVILYIIFLYIFCLV